MARSRRTAARAELPQKRMCATDQVHLRLLLEDPGYAERRAKIENQAWRAAQLPQFRTGCTRIPVVVHVVWRVNAENISKAQIDSQITVLNQDFRRTNADIGNVPAPFQAAIGDARIEFALATTDPNGNPTDGVTRTQTNVNGFSYLTDDVKSAATGGADPWPADEYLNVWVCKLAGGLLGYAQFPGGLAATDGVVILDTAFGTTGTAAAPFHLGRTATHEIGHWLNLRHIWGDDYGACSGDDFVADTPNQGGPNFDTPTFPTISCNNGPNGDMFMNYMDYVDDPVMIMFTAGQVVRMQAALDGPRSTIGTSISCGPKLKFADEPITLKFRDDPITLKFQDDPVTLKYVDDPITLKFVDDPIGTFKVVDEINTAKAFDDVKQPTYDKPPFSDQPMTPPWLPMPTPFGGPAPFVLSTPHHSQAWEASYPGVVGSDRGAYEQQLGEYERVLREYAEADERGELGDSERAAIEELYRQYTELGEAYRRQFGGSERG
jgi:Pregnancy-associated plasma protein-A